MSSREDVFPVDETFPQLAEVLRENRPLILKAAPGAGKSTRVPPFILKQAWLSGKKILMLEPRRLAARSCAHFMASQVGENVGETYGYRVRLDSQVSENTLVEVVTEGMLSQRLIDDPELSGVGCVIFDEFHERHLSGDLGLGLVIQCREHFREDLRLVLMSATMDEEPLLKLMPDAEVVQSQGRQFPVDIEHRKSAEDYPDLDLIAKTTWEELKKKAGDVLVFCPGAREVDQVVEQLKGRISRESEQACQVLALYGRMSMEEQTLATSPKASGMTTAIVCTDIAETSLTIPNIKVVVDSGFSRTPSYDAKLGTTRLVLGMISRDSAEQRAGRAGRLSEGRAIRLWSTVKHKGLLPASRAEIEMGNLEKTVLDLVAWGSACEDFPWVTPPQSGHWAVAEQRLSCIGAVASGQLTEIGQALRAFPMDPLLARVMVMGERMHLPQLAALLCCWWQSRDAHARGVDDLELRLESYAQVLKRNKGRDWREYQDLCKRVGAAPHLPRSMESLASLLFEACPERFAMHRGGDEPRYLMAQGGEFVATRGLGRFVCAIVLHARHRGGVALSVGLKVAEAEMLSMLGSSLDWQPRYRYDLEAKKVRSTEVQAWMDWLMHERALAKPLAQAQSDCFWEHIQSLGGLEHLPMPKTCLQWLRRFEWYEMKRLGEVTWTQQRWWQNLDQWLKPFVVGLSDWKALESIDWAYALQSVLDPNLVLEMERQLPSAWQAPSGSMISIDYDQIEAPVLSVKIQEMFGCSKTPTIMNGELPLTIHLLSPARRPVQVTQDLESFWSTGYFEVRKELKRRYPKHDWPDDPHQAQAHRGVKRRS